MTVRFPLVVAILAPLVCFAANPTEELFSAAESGDAKKIEELVAEGANVNAKTKNGATPLMFAVNWNRREAVILLLRLGADPNLDAGESSPLFTASGRDTEIVRLLLDAGANPNFMTKKLKYTALGMAACNKKETFETLSKTGGYVGPFPNTVETVRLLVRAGADINRPDGSIGAYPLKTALRCGNLEIARVLLEAGAKIDVSPGYTPIMDAVMWYSNFKSLDPVRMLLDFGANPNDRNSELWDEFNEEKNGCGWCGYTLLTFAAKRGYYDIVKLLLERGADPAVPRTDGVTALELATQNGRVRTAALIETHLKRQRKSP